MRTFRKVALATFFLHSAVLTAVLCNQLTATGEDWSALVPITLDYPVEAILYSLMDLVIRWVNPSPLDAYRTSTMIHFAVDFVFGGLWWVFVSYVLAWCVRWIRQRNRTRPPGTAEAQR
jgi:hypothetical protein